MCVGAMEAGAIGVTFGRNIFQHRNPRGLLNALSEIIFEGKKPKGVSKELG
jgi:fructose-bisphosphate aldolase/2-amino-3,7-dideoxy-D-threo-hept-6-ulosonate synthase